MHYENLFKYDTNYIKNTIRFYYKMRNGREDGKKFRDDADKRKKAHRSEKETLANIKEYENAQENIIKVFDDFFLHEAKLCMRLSMEQFKEKKSKYLHQKKYCKGFLLLLFK